VEEKGGKKHFYMQLVAWYFRLRDERLWRLFYIKDENVLLVVKMKNPHSLTHSPQAASASAS